jgi:hypothetical protein
MRTRPDARRAARDRRFREAPGASADGRVPRCSVRVVVDLFEGGERVETVCVGSGLLGRVVRRQPLVAPGKSGAQLERCWLDDGSAVVVKHADASKDWIMQATGDDGRIVALWADGLFGRIPASIDHAVLEVQPSAGGAIVVMRDVSAYLAPDGQMPSSLHRRVLAAAAQLHAAFEGSPVRQLCALPAYYTFLSPAVCARFAADHEVPRLALEGWTRFHDIVAGDVAQAIAEVHADPGPLVDALLARNCTLVHGDLKLANLGEHAGQVIVLDWGTLTTWAPPAVDHAWYLAINAAALGAHYDRIIADIRARQREHDDIAQRLALIGAFAQLGWEKALGATARDVETRHRERAGLDWWTSQVRKSVSLL